MTILEREREDFFKGVLTEQHAENQVDEMRLDFTAGWFAALRALNVETNGLRDARSVQIWERLYSEACDAIVDEYALLLERQSGRDG